MVANRTDDGTPLDNTNGGDNDGNGANRAVLTQEVGQRAPDELNNDEDNANDGENSSTASDEGAGGGGDGSEFKVWNGLWPGPEGRVAKYMIKDAGDMQDQKDKTAQLFDFIVKPNAHLTVLGADT